MSNAYDIADKVLKYLYDNNNCLRTDIETSLHPYNIFPSLDELVDSKLIGHNAAKSYYNIRPEGISVIDQYQSYSKFKMANKQPFDIDKFKIKLDYLLSDNLFKSIDILSILQHNIENRSKDEINSIRQQVSNIILGYKQSGFINVDDETIGFLANMSNFVNLDESIIIQPTIEFEKYLKSKESKQGIVDKSMHFHGDTKGTFSTGDGVSQSYSESSKSDRPKWLTLSFYWDEIVKFGWKWIIVAVVGILSTYLGCHFSTDKELSMSLTSPKQIQPPEQTDSLKKTDTADR